MEICFYKGVLERILEEEKRVGLTTNNVIDESYQMITYLQNQLHELKISLSKSGFSNEREEITFFKKVKPQILGKLIYYNKVFRIETTCPVNRGKMFYNHFENHLKTLKLECKERISNEDFYRYYRADRIDRDDIYFRLGKINYHDGLKSGVFEIDLNFSTYYDNKVARIIASELLYVYLLTKINKEENLDSLLTNSDESKELYWTNSQNALIELIYALYVSNSISGGKISIRKLALKFQLLFQIPLNDIHHSFHRMKTRAGSRTLFLDQLKKSLEEYMDKDI